MKAALSLLEAAHISMGRAIKPGDTVLDATAGNGHDTVLLAGLVGDTGQVLAFEPQPLARKRTAAKLRAKGWLERVRLIDDGHENLARYVNWPLSAAMFNLGFLPGSDRRVVTTPHTTLTALNVLLSLLAPGGLISVHCYSGHNGGREESAAVLDWACCLSGEQWLVYCYQTLNKPANPENLLLLEYKQRRTDELF